VCSGWDAEITACSYKLLPLQALWGSLAGRRAAQNRHINEIY